MLSRLLKAIFESGVCEECRDYEATQGSLCVYCHLDDRLSQSAQVKKPTPFSGELNDKEMAPSNQFAR
jgi:hypothetical protein